MDSSEETNGEGHIHGVVVAVNTYAYKFLRSLHDFYFLPLARHPVSRQAPVAVISPCRPLVAFCVISQNPVDSVLDLNGPDCTLSPVLDIALNYEDEDEKATTTSDGVQTLSMAKRRKRGRKGEGMTPLTIHTQTSERLALAS